MKSNAVQMRSKKTRTCRARRDKQKAAAWKYGWDSWAGVALETYGPSDSPEHVGLLDCLAKFPTRLKSSGRHIPNLGLPPRFTLGFREREFALSVQYQRLRKGLIHQSSLW